MSHFADIGRVVEFVESLPLFGRYPGTNARETVRRAGGRPLLIQEHELMKGLS
jgi:hypothetical protein